MGHLPFILAAVAIVARDGFERPIWSDNWSPLASALVLLGALAGIVLILAVRLWGLYRAMDRRGSVRAARRASGAIRHAQFALALAFVVGVIAFGWLDAVRTWIGDGVGYDELVAILPLLVASMCCAGLGFGLERRLREAALLRQIDEGATIYAVPTRWAHVWLFTRQQPLFVLLPVLTILSWSECVALIADGPLAFAMQVGGAIALLALAPLMVRFLWDTTPIRAGALGDRLRTMASSHGVGVRAFLVWHTGGAQVNAAVIGLLPWLRYVVITDALLESLPGPEVEAVAAHEIGHIRRRHMPWLIGAAMGPALVLGLAGERLALALGLVPTLPGLIAGGAGALIVFGMVSRRFERQADSFAAQHLSHGAPQVEEHAASVMVSALRRVAHLNGLPVDRPTWRHGSIGTRCRALGTTIGSRFGRTPPDHAAAWAKLMVLVLVLAGGFWATLDALSRS
ncbi:MAG: M48 family metallopeptidase [Planctomycetota bacterium]